jgi:hypothetical protein
VTGKEFVPAAIVDAVRRHDTRQIRLVARLTPLMATKAIYEKRIVAWDQMSGA